MISGKKDACTPDSGSVSDLREAPPASATSASRVNLCLYVGGVIRQAGGWAARPRAAEIALSTPNWGHQGQADRQRNWKASIFCLAAAAHAASQASSGAGARRRQHWAADGVLRTLPSFLRLASERAELAATQWRARHGRSPAARPLRRPRSAVVGGVGGMAAGLSLRRATRDAGASFVGESGRLS
ncbi:uncharacterized protein K452DRAFT_17230 [Aplosporella prunicola CBS 121167]|uniref:Uncharacterized protein n=1 Tax=Aplosporella prunicola CBS 121167 TaxID=1176127 RepID=A0A6A6BDU6_9PEZI|nr:uncharacterized protein K452DRAFT_17230 [Aplosporella prunicola CBS 121167]KAF2142340.1 hypothetical protein K452DRAFT_17230 [Aplosporella prunicola CBS 121167]